MRKLESSKPLLIRDPIYGTITIDDELILALLNHPFFQRLRRIQQMSVAHLTFPGAMHTRFHHSLGAYHLMNLALTQLQKNGTSINKDEKRAAQIAILLHDIGHGAFSHTLEYMLVRNIQHEALSLRMMHILNEQFNGALSLAISIFQGTYARHFFHQLVSSQLDVDRLDYLTRDSFYAGVAEGIIGYDRILSMLLVYEGKLLIQEKGAYSIEQFLISRRIMYWQVYYHKNVWATEQLVKNIFKRSKYLYTLNALDVRLTESLFFLMSQPFDIDNAEHMEHFAHIDDTDILCLIKAGATSQDLILRLLCDAYLNRKMYEVKVCHQPQDKIDLVAVKQQIKQKWQVTDKDLHYFIVEACIQNKIYDPTDKDKIYFLDKHAQIVHITDINFLLIQQGVHSAQKKYYQAYWKYFSS